MAATEERKAYQASLIEILQSRPMSYWPALAKKVGGVKNAVMLSQLLYWNGNQTAQKRGGWFYKSVEEMENETGLTKYEQQTAREELTTAGLIDTKLKGMPRVWHYKVNFDNVADLFIGSPAHSMEEPPNDGIQNPPTLGDEPAQLKESVTTPVITPVTTGKETPRKKQRGPSENKPPAGDGDNPKEGSDNYRIACALAEVCGMDLKKNPRLFREAQKFTVSEIPAILADYGRDGPWYSRDWRGKLGELPKPEYIRETWGRFSNGHSNGSNGHHPPAEPETPYIPRGYQPQVYQPKHPPAALERENWQGALEVLKDEKGSGAFANFIEPLQLADYHDGVYTAVVGNGMLINWLQANAQRRLEELLGGTVRILPAVLETITQGA